MAREVCWMGELTEMLNAGQQGDVRSAEELLPLVYDELRKIAARKIASERPGQTLQATALLHEAYLRLLASSHAGPWEGRAHFIGAAAEAMRRILVEVARRKSRVKHGGELLRVDSDLVDIPLPMPNEQLLALDEALTRLAVVDARAAQVVNLCFFMGLTQQQAAGEMGVSLATAERLWSFARAWLFRELQQGKSV